jgi:release factor glutamine methyltransferase
VALMPPEARDHEPRRALDGGADGLDVQRRVITGAPAWLAPDGVLLVETSAGQAAGTADAMAAAGLTARTIRDADLDATVVVATGISGSRTPRRRAPSRSGRAGR